LLGFLYAKFLLDRGHSIHYFAVGSMDGFSVYKKVCLGSPEAHNTYPAHGVFLFVGLDQPCTGVSID
jgi:hypothetical protein